MQRSAGRDRQVEMKNLEEQWEKKRSRTQELIDEAVNRLNQKGEVLTPVKIQAETVLADPLGKGLHLSTIGRNYSDPALSKETKVQTSACDSLPVPDLNDLRPGRTRVRVLRRLLKEPIAVLALRVFLLEEALISTRQRLDELAHQKLKIEQDWMKFKKQHPKKEEAVPGKQA